MKADYYRYLAEFKNGEAKMASGGTADEAYTAGTPQARDRTADLHAALRICTVRYVIPGDAPADVHTLHDDPDHARSAKAV